MPKIVYVTGAPAAGKSSTVEALRAEMRELHVWEYGARLTDYLQARSRGILDQDDLRTRSASVVTPSDIAVVDQQLLDFVDRHRGVTSVLIDSHPVTKEEYGFRITAFSLEQIRKLAPDEIWVFFASPQETRRRIELSPGGRPLPSEEDARSHSALQAALAATYGVMAPAPVYLFDTSHNRDEVLKRLMGRLK